MSSMLASELRRRLIFAAMLALLGVLILVDGMEARRAGDDIVIGECESPGWVESSPAWEAAIEAGCSLKGDEWVCPPTKADVEAATAVMEHVPMLEVDIESVGQRRPVTDGL